MKICYVGGNVPLLMHLMKSMASRGHEVYWIALDRIKYGIENVIIESFMQNMKGGIKKYVLSIPNFIQFRLILDRICPDVLHAVNVRKAGWFSVLSGFKPVIVTTQGGDVMDRNYTHRSSISMWIRKNLVRKWLRRYTLENATVVTYGSNTMLDAIRFWAEPKQTFNYFQGVNLNQFNLKVDVSRYKRCLGFNISRKIVFSPRMFNSNANIDIIIRCIPKVKKKFHDVLFIFTAHYGIDDYSIYLRELVDELNVRQNCLFLEEIGHSEMPIYYGASDVVLSILTSDGMPATILEAMALKRPLILSKIPTYLAVFKEWAVMVEHRDVTSTADAIISVLANDPVLNLEKKTKDAFRWTKEFANEQILNDQLEELYEELLWSHDQFTKTGTQM